MHNKWILRISLVLVVGVVVFAYNWFGLAQYLSLESLKTHQAAIHTYYLAEPFRLMGVFALIYIVSTALSLPGATILTLAAGAIFGFGTGFVLVSFASTVGATLAFLASRFLLRDFIQNKFKSSLTRINEGIKKDGAFYLFTLRLVPIFPFFLINLVMGLTSIGTLTFFFISQIGMLAGTAVYINAGTQLAQIESIKGILSINIILSFVLIGVFPLFSKWVIAAIKSKKHLKKFKKPSRFDYNMVVIGAGSAGLVSAYIAAAVKAKVALIEKHKMGGDCLNTGCVPSKALIRTAKIFKYIKRSSEFGIENTSAKINFAKVMERVQKIIKEVEPHDSVERYSKLGVECIQGEAKIRTPYEVEVNGKILTTKNIVIATGASPLVPTIPGLSEIKYLTSDNLWNLRELPQRLVILGAGPIGCELAQSFVRFGSKVTLVEMAPRIMSREDDDVSTMITETFQKEGVSVLTSHKALRVEASDKILVCEFQGREVRIPFDEILIALGRKANVNGFGLENLNIEISDRGTVVADEFLRTTNYPNIYTCGDVTGPYQFTHTASHQAWYVAVNALFSPLKKYKVDYNVIPWCTFTDPEVAHVGLNEQEAKEKGIPYQVSRYGIDDLDRAIAEGEAHGFVKVITPPGSDKILGVTIVCAHAGDIISEYVAAMKHGFGLNKILSAIHIYPTFAEANKYAAGVWKKANAPKKALEFLAKYHSWRRNWIDRTKLFLFAALVIPTTNLSEWKIEQYSSVPKNEITTSAKGLLIRVNGSAGPLIYPLKEKRKISGFKVSGEFLGLPKLTNSSLQGEKGFDDYPLRLGFVIPGEKRLSGLKKMFAAQWVKSLYEQVQDETGLDSIRFFNVTQNSKQVGQKRVHPASDLFQEEFFAEVKRPGAFTYELKFKQPIETVAVWISIDGDDTKSVFEVLISSLELQPEGH